MKTIHKLVCTSALIASTTLVGCTSPGEVEGSVSGYSLEVKDAFFSQETNGVGVFLSDSEGLCDAFKANRTPKDTTLMGFVLFRRGETMEEVLPVIPGEYTIFPLSSGGTPPKQFALGYFVKKDGTCEDVIPDENSNVQSGIVKLTKLESGKEMEGEFDITVGKQGDKLKGTFSGMYCEGKSSNDSTCG